jgi:hypothetical protein
MGIGTSIFLLALGAILAFAVSAEKVAGIELSVVGYILMAAGALGLIISMLLMNRARHATVVRERDVY